MTTITKERIGIEQTTHWMLLPELRFSLLRTT